MKVTSSGFVLIFSASAALARPQAGVKQGTSAQQAAAAQQGTPVNAAAAASAAASSNAPFVQEPALPKKHRQTGVPPVGVLVPPYPDGSPYYPDSAVGGQNNGPLSGQGAGSEDSFDDSQGGAGDYSGAQSSLTTTPKVNVSQAQIAADLRKLRLDMASLENAVDGNSPMSNTNSLARSGIENQGYDGGDATDGADGADGASDTDGESDAGSETDGESDAGSDDGSDDGSDNGLGGLNLNNSTIGGNDGSYGDDGNAGLDSGDESDGADSGDESDDDFQDAPAAQPSSFPQSYNQGSYADDQDTSYDQGDNSTDQGSYNDQSDYNQQGGNTTAGGDYSNDQGAGYDQGSYNDQSDYNQQGGNSTAGGDDSQADY